MVITSGLLNGPTQYSCSVFFTSAGNGAVFTSCFSPVSVTSKIAEETNDNSQIVSSTVKPVSLQRLVSFSHRVVQVACGIDHTILLTATGVVYSCGIGRYAALACLIIYRLFISVSLSLPVYVCMHV